MSMSTTVVELDHEYEVIKNSIINMLSPKRFSHSLNVEKEAVKLGRIYGVDEQKCKLAGISHDCAKQFNNEALIVNAKKYEINIDEIQYNFPGLLHGPVGAMYVKENFGIQDEDILNSITYHTTGRVNMSLLEKIIYLADIIEESRDFPEIKEIRRISTQNLDEALILSCNCTLKYIMKNNSLIHPLTIEFRNSLLLKGVRNNG